MRKPTARKAVLLVFLALASSSLGPHGSATTGTVSAPGSANAASLTARSTSDIPPEVRAAVLEKRGRLVREDGAVSVYGVTLPRRLRTTYSSLPETLYRVVVRGDFPPRALRYEVRSERRLVGYGMPAESGRAVTAVTGSKSVLSEEITAVYEGGRLTPAADFAGQGLALLDEMPDPNSRGPLAVTRAEYDLGEEVFQPSDLAAKVELTGSVHYPRDLAGGPYPLVVFMHGNHSTCYRGRRTGYRWPCRTGWKPIPNYAGYDYISRRLASHGFVVASISANGVNVHGGRLDDTGMRQRGELLDAHLDLFRTWSTVGGKPFDTTFVGNIDLSRIGTMGHSRGGEGVAWHKIVDEERPDPYGVDAVLALAPVDFTRVKVNDVAFAVVLPYCDGDVSDLQGVHIFDDSRYAVPGDAAPKHGVTAFAANHNFFNIVWSPGHGYPGAFNDGRWSGCSSLLTQRQQRRVGRAYIAGFFRRYLTSETALDPMWVGSAAPSSIAPARTLVTYHAPDTATNRMDLVQFADPDGLASGENGTVVSARALDYYAWCSGSWDITCVPGRAGWRDVHNPGLGRGLVGWSDRGAALRLDLSADRGDVSGFDALQFRAVINPGFGVNRRARYQDLSVVLIDGAGNKAAQRASAAGNEALAFPLSGGRRARGHIIMHQVRFPLTGFRGVDLSTLDAVEIRFNRTVRGLLNFSDVAFSRPPG